MIWPMTMTEMYNADLNGPLWTGRMYSFHLNGRNDLQTRFGSVPVTKALNVALDIFDDIATHMLDL